ncbi:unnamed protein product [Lactuca saligna]|uniref:Uncharacterized protein n=1 Tax=Lactuca saligna TaxID=75948 RepID=A0AA36E7P7_LACSI|nr:unnamed protein product [Lactuca saligna]
MRRVWRSGQEKIDLRKSMVLSLLADQKPSMRASVNNLSPRWSRHRRQKPAAPLAPPHISVSINSSGTTTCHRKHIPIHFPQFSSTFVSLFSPIPNNHPKPQTGEPKSDPKPPSCIFIIPLCLKNTTDQRGYQFQSITSSRHLTANEISSTEETSTTTITSFSAAVTVTVTIAGCHPRRHRQWLVHLLLRPPSLRVFAAATKGVICTPLQVPLASSPRRQFFHRSLPFHENKEEGDHRGRGDSCHFYSHIFGFNCFSQRSIASCHGTSETT